MSDMNNTRNSHASLILFIVVSLVLAVAALTLVVGPQYSPSIGVISAQVLAKVDGAFRAAMPTPWFRWFALWSVAGAVISVMIGLLILPRSAEAPSNFERGAIATAELSRIVVIVLAVGVSFFDFITAPKDHPLGSARHAEAVKPADGPTSLSHQNTPAATEATPMTPATPEEQVEVATSDVEPSSARVDGHNQPLSAKADPNPQPPAQNPTPTASRPSRFDPQPSAAPQPQNDSRGARDTASTSNSGATGAAGTLDRPAANGGPDNMSLADDLLPWERSPRDPRLGSPTPGRPKPPSSDRYGSNGTSGGYGPSASPNGSEPSGGYSSRTPGGYGANGANSYNGRENGSPGPYASASPNPREERDPGRQQPGACDSVRGRFYNVKGRNNPDYEATIEIMARGRGLIRLMTRRGEVVLMDARVTSCTGNKIIVVGSNGRTEAGIDHDNYRDDVFVAPYQRQSREDWGR